MPDLENGQTYEMQGSGKNPYKIKNVGGVYSCTCPAWCNQSLPSNARTCKHVRKLRGDAAEELRLATAGPLKPLKPEGAEDVKELPILLAHVWTDEHDPTGWWMSEKLDGVRAYWDGAQFLSRLGNVYHAPPWFTAGLPKHLLDGELFTARKAFQRTVGIVKRQDHPETWTAVRFVIFDAPHLDAPFEDRQAFLTTSVAGWGNAYATILEQARCESLAAMRAKLAELEALGAEGLMLRQPGSRYAAGRSSTLLKVKSFRDAEAVVVGYEPGKGKHKGRVGSLLCELPDGKRFNVGTGLTDAERTAPPAVGTTITFQYQELSDDGIPRFPSYLGVRTD